MFLPALQSLGEAGALGAADPTIAARCDVLLATDETNWLEAVEEMRRCGSPARILIVTIRNDSVARVAAFRAGADDAASFPCSDEEIAMRVRALLDRGPRRIAIGGLVIDSSERRVWRDGIELPLLPREYALLLHFARNPGQVIPRQRLLEQVWKLRFDPGTNVVEVHMCRLRARLDRGFKRKLLETVKGRGYRLALPDDC